TDIESDDVRALAGEGDGSGAADAAGGARDHCHLFPQKPVRCRRCRGHRTLRLVRCNFSESMLRDARLHESAHAAGTTYHPYRSDQWHRSRPVWSLFRHEDILARELLEDGGILRKVGREDVGRIPGDPLGEVDRLVMAAVED